MNRAASEIVVSVKVNARLRRQVFERAKGQCEYCRSQALYTTETFEIEHILPLALGGETVQDNIAPACSGCSGRKSHKIEANNPDTGNRAALFHPRRISEQLIFAGWRKVRSSWN